MADDGVNWDDIEDYDDSLPPGLDSDNETVEYDQNEFRSADGDDDPEIDENDFYVDSEEFFLSTSDVPAINAYLKACGTHSTDTPAEMPVASSEAAAKGPSDVPPPSSGGSPLAMVAVEFTRAMSLLLVPDEATYLPPLGEGEHYVFEFYASGFKRTVVERANNILTIDEARQLRPQSIRPCWKSCNAGATSRPSRECRRPSPTTWSTPAGSSSGRRSRERG